MQMESVGFDSQIPTCDGSILREEDSTAFFGCQNKIFI